jgi:hypothetical protein
MAGHAYDRWHVAIIDPHGHARHVTHETLLGRAAQVAEGQVRHRIVGKA